MVVGGSKTSSGPNSTHFFHPATVDELVQVQRSSAMWTLTPLFRQPAPDAKVAAKLGAMGTKMSIPAKENKVRLLSLSLSLYS